MEYDGAVGFLIGEANAGMRYMFTMMNNARLSVGLEGLCLAERAYQAAVTFAQDRTQGRALGAAAGTSSPIVEHADVRRMLLHMRSHIEAMRALAYTNAWAIDMAKHGADDDARTSAQELADLLTPVTKGWCTDLGSELTRLATQIHGGAGYIGETGVEQHERDIRIAAIYEGTNGIQAMDLVGRKLPMRAGGVVAEQLAAMDATAASLEGDLAPIGERLGDAVAALREATDWVLANGLSDPQHALAGATPYLRMFGTVLGGWFLARQAQAASQAGDDDFHRAKAVTARYYAEQVLPTARGLLPAVIAGADVLFALTPEQLTSS
jgi:acyl-CoA dehydrogenase